MPARFLIEQAVWFFRPVQTAWLALTLFFACPITMPAALAQDDPPPLRVVTYNLLHDGPTSRVANPDMPGPTVWQRIDMDASTAATRVDFILYLPGSASSAAVRSSRVILDRPGRLPDGRVLWPSDHYGVLAEIDIRPLVRQGAEGR